MGLRDILKKKNELADSNVGDEKATSNATALEFTFIRTDTATQDIIYPPDVEHDGNHLSPKESGKSTRRSMDFFRSRSRASSVSSQSSLQSPKKEPAGRRLSQRLHLSRQPESSENVPENLPAIVAPVDPQDKDGVESQWEKRATMLAGQNEMARTRSESPGQSTADAMIGMAISTDTEKGRSRSPSRSREVSSKAIDQDIQEAIRLHEEGDLEKSTKMFGQLADEKGANNPLSQVLYGLALRHGWGCEPNPGQAVKYLSAAASNAASVEQLALQAGMKKGGAAKGELVLAIFELANCFRHGWGIDRDPIAAKQYYETAANLGDTDAMNEIAWCYLEGFGCKKNKLLAAKYYRQAEKGGNKTLGNSWIWKEKYDPKEDGKSK